MIDSFGNKVLELLNKSDMTQKKLAEKINITEATLSRYINGDREPKSEVVANIATALHTTTDFLLGVEDDSSVLSYPKISRILARNVDNFSPEQKNNLVKLLLNLK
jgi:transcriptional regulator with XRE-family HTH domain